MNSNKQSNNKAFCFLLQALQDLDSNEICIGEQEKKLAKLKIHAQELLRNIRIMAINYFTAEKIIELHEKSVRLLGCDDFDADEYIHLFSEISKLELCHIDFLLRRKEEIDSTEEKLNSNAGSIFSKEKKKKLLVNFFCNNRWGSSANDD